MRRVHPGHPEYPPMQVVLCDNIVDCLEFDLTRCDSADDWPPNPMARSLSDSVSHHNHFAVLDPPVLADDPLVLTRSLQWKLTMFEWSTVDRGCV